MKNNGVAARIRYTYVGGIQVLLLYTYRRRVSKNHKRFFFAVIVKIVMRLVCILIWQ